MLNLTFVKNIRRAIIKLKEVRIMFTIVPSDESRLAYHRSFDISLVGAKKIAKVRINKTSETLFNIGTFNN